MPDWTEMSHVVHPALQVSSWSWFWTVVGGTNLSSSIRLMGLVWVFSLIWLWHYCNVICSACPWSGGGSRAAWGWLLLFGCMCATPWHGTASALDEGITSCLTPCLCPGDLISVPVGGEELRAAAGKSLSWLCSFMRPGFKENGRRERPNEGAESGGWQAALLSFQLETPNDLQQKLFPAPTPSLPVSDTERL